MFDAVKLEALFSQVHGRQNTFIHNNEVTQTPMNLVSCLKFRNGKQAFCTYFQKDYFQKMDWKYAPRKELTHQLVPAEVPLKIFSPIVQVTNPDLSR